MRELKFRAWDNATNIMIAEGFHVIGEVTMFKIIEEHIDNNRFGKTTMERFADIQVMQWCGLKDKNGKEVYEGDLVVWDHLDSELHYEVYFNDKEYIYACRTVGKDHDNAIECWLDNLLRVVGNVHQNPELL